MDFDWVQVAGYIIAAIFFVFGAKWNLRNLLMAAGVIAKEAGELLTEFSKAAADGDLTGPEIAAIADQADDLPEAIKKAKELAARKASESP